MDEKTNTDDKTTFATVPREALVGDWAVVRRDYPRDAGIAELLARQVAERPEAEAVVADAERITYAELHRRSGRLAHRLVASGVGRGTPVAVVLGHSLDLVVTLVAIIRAGGAYVPLDAAYPEERLRFMLGDVGAPVVVTRSGLADRLPVPQGTELLLLDRPWDGEDEAAARPFADRPAGPLDLAYVTYTSGSTGRPKGVAIPHRGVVRLVMGTDYARFGPDQTFLHLAAVTFDLTTLEVWGPLLTGGRLVVFTGGTPTPDRIAEVLERERVTFLWLTAGLFHQMAEARPEGLRPVEQLLAGGDALAATACRKVVAACPGTLLIDGYGPTENTTLSSWHPMPTVESVSDPVSIGRPVANSEAFVLGPDLEVLAPGEVGELRVGGDGLARGYWRRPALTAERFVPHPHSDRPGERLYHTGDLARWRDDGNLEYLGRRDHQVKLRGIRVELGEIESVLGEHPAVGEVVVVARDVDGPDGVADRILVAYVVAARQAEAAPDPRELRAHAAARLPEQILPAAYVALDRLPLSPNGKVDRRALPAPGPEHRATATRYVPPRGADEKILAAIWEQVLGAERVGLEDDFFELGGHSLLAGSIFGRVTHRLGVQMPLDTLFHHRTLRAFADAVAARMVAGKRVGELPPIEPRSPAVRADDGSEELLMTRAQRGLWITDHLRPESAAYNLPTRLELRGEGLDLPALAWALGDVVRRHEGLRVRFEAGGEGLGVQRIHPPADGPFPLAVVDLTGLGSSADRRRTTSAIEEVEAHRPFDLESTDAAADDSHPLVRGLLIRRSDDLHHLIVHAHHAVSDGWSVEIVVRELRALYRQRATGEPAGLSELPVSFGDAALWLREVFDEARLSPELDHWMAHLDGMPLVLDLPTDRTRARNSSDRGAEARLRIEPETVAALAALARAEGATLFMALVAGFELVLGRWSGKDDFALGTPVAGRPRPELEALVGMFTNIVVLRADLSGEPTFRELLGRARRETIRALAHHALPFDRVVEAFGDAVEIDQHPLAQVLFAGQDFDLVDGELAPGLDVRAEILPTGASRVDLTLFADRRAGAIEARFEYATELFDRATIERLADQWRRTLEAAAVTPDLPVTRLPLLAPTEREEILGPWRGRPSGAPPGIGLGELFARQAAATPEAVAVSAGGETMTYAELDRRSRELAHRIVASRSPFAPGTPVGLALERSVELVVAVVAVVRAGGLYVPLDTDYPEERLRFMTDDAGVAILVTDGRSLEHVPFLTEGADLAVVRVDRASSGLGAPDAERPLPEPLGAEAAAYLLYTSGSTGRPKGVVVPHRAVARLVLGADYAAFGPDETFLLLAPVSFDAATLELWGPLLTGGRLAIYPPGPILPEELGEVLRRERVTTLWLTAGLFHQVVEDALEVLAPLQRLLAGGDVLSPELCRRVLEAHPHLVLVNGYGPTENTTFTCCHELTESAAVGSPVPVGRPIRGTFVTLRDRRLRLQPEGVPGELLAGGDGLAWGYWNRPALTAERFVPDPEAGGSAPAGARSYRTGDLARWRPGGVVEFLGRYDGQVKLRGFRIELGEIASVLSAHPAVRRAAVVVRSVGSDGDGGEGMLVGYAVLDPAVEDSIAEGELSRWLLGRLPSHMVPSVLVRLDELPLDPNGKVDRKALPLPSGDSLRTPPRNETERAVASIWSELLDVDQPNVEDDFFRLGGHSLLVARAISRFKAHFGVALTFGEVYVLRTLGSIAARLATAVADATSNEESGPGRSIRRVSRRRMVRPTPGNRRRKDAADLISGDDS